MTDPHHIQQPRSRPSAEAAWVFSGQILTVLAAAAGVRVLTELMDPVAYGKLALGMTAVALTQQILFAPLGKAVLRHYVSAKERSNVHEYFRAAVGRLAKISRLSATVGVLLVAGLALGGLREWLWIAAVAIVLGILTGWDGVLSAFQSAARKRSVVACQTTLGACLRVAFAALLLLTFGPRSELAMAGYAGAAALVAGLRYGNLKSWAKRQNSKTEVPTDWSAPIWQFAWPLGIVGAFTWAQIAAPRWALDVLGTRADVGMFAVLFQLGYYPMAISASTLNQLVEPILFDRAGGGGDSTRRSIAHADRRRLTAFTLALTAAAFVAALGLHETLFGWLVADPYRPVSYLLPWMVLAAGLSSAAQLAVLSFMVDLKTRETIAVRGVTSTVGILLTIWGIYVFGVPGAVFAAIAFGAFDLLWMSHLTRRRNASFLRT